MRTSAPILPKGCCCLKSKVLHLSGHPPTFVCLQDLQSWQSCTTFDGVLQLVWMKCGTKYSHLQLSPLPQVGNDFCIYFCTTISREQYLTTWCSCILSLIAHTFLGLCCQPLFIIHVWYKYHEQCDTLHIWYTLWYCRPKWGCKKQNKKTLIYFNKHLLAQSKPCVHVNWWCAKIWGVFESFCAC